MPRISMLFERWRLIPFLFANKHLLTVLSLKMSYWTAQRHYRMIFERWIELGYQFFPYISTFLPLTDDDRYLDVLDDKEWCLQKMHCIQGQLLTHWQQLSVIIHQLFIKDIANITLSFI
jgi:hypothetical protein